MNALIEEDPQIFAREKNRLRGRAWRAKNPTTVKESLARWRAKNPLAGKEWKAKNPGYFLKYRLEKNYGLSVIDYQKMVEKQQGLCAICAGLMKSPQVDHCHATGKPRGLLCGSCNRGIGSLKDSLVILQNALSYLKQYAE